MVVVLGLVHGISFSASYQLVSRFAGKNTISLGLGCVGSGFIVLLLELALRLRSSPSRHQNMGLYLASSGTCPLPRSLVYLSSKLSEVSIQDSAQNSADALRSSYNCDNDDLR